MAVSLRRIADLARAGVGITAAAALAIIAALGMMRWFWPFWGKLCITDLAMAGMALLSWGAAVLFFRRRRVSSAGFFSPFCAGLCLMAAAYMAFPYLVFSLPAYTLWLGLGLYGILAVPPIVCFARAATAAEAKVRVSHTVQPLHTRTHAHTHLPQSQSQSQSQSQPLRPLRPWAAGIFTAALLLAAATGLPDRVLERASGESAGWRLQAGGGDWTLLSTHRSFDSTVRVARIADEKNQPRRALVRNGRILDLVRNDGLPLSFSPYAMLALAQTALPQGGDALVMGMGGGSLPYLLSERKFRVDVLEPSGAVWRAGEKDIGYSAVVRRRISDSSPYHFARACNPRVSLPSIGHYDLVVLDYPRLYGTVPAWPGPEALLAALAACLKPDGFLIVHGYGTPSRTEGQMDPLEQTEPVERTLLQALTRSFGTTFAFRRQSLEARVAGAPEAAFYLARKGGGVLDAIADPVFLAEFGEKVPRLETRSGIPSGFGFDIELGISRTGRLVTAEDMAALPTPGLREFLAAEMAFNRALQKIVLGSGRKGLLLN